MFYFLIGILIFTLFIIAFINQPKFGKHPSGKRLQAIKNSPNYKNGSFQNLNHTPALSEDSTYYRVAKEFFIGNKQQVAPLKKLPTQKTDLHNLAIHENVLVWFGHSSYFMQIDGKRMLVDPVFSGAASPIPNNIKAFKGTNNYSVNDIPNIDYLFITHDHWDHLDYKTVLALKSKVKYIICALGVGSHLEYWGFKSEIIFEKDWNEEIKLDAGFTIFTTPARHFSGRGVVRNKTLWTSYVLQTPNKKIFIGGDSGYDTHFKDIGNTFGGFDLAIIENGQYDKNWKYIHLLPEQFLKAASDLNAKQILPVHSCKFALANHAWEEPLTLVIQNNKQYNLNIATPMIGESLNLNDTTQNFKEWWLNEG